MFEFTHRHQSMKWNAPSIDVRDALNEHRRNASVITGTEGNNKRWAFLLRAQGWETMRDPGPTNRGDCWVSWDRDTWEDKGGFTRRLSTVTYDGRSPWATVQKLRHRQQGFRVLFVVVHLPAHIEADIRVRRTTRVRAHLTGMRGLRRLINDIRRDHPWAHVVVCGDWNLNLHRRWVRTYIKTGLRGCGLKPAPIPRDGGTHGPRLIDWALSDLVTRGQVLHHNTASDHRPVAFTHGKEK